MRHVFLGGDPLKIVNLVIPLIAILMVHLCFPNPRSEKSFRYQAVDGPSFLTFIWRIRNLNDKIAAIYLLRFSWRVDHSAIDKSASPDFSGVRNFVTAF